MNEFILAVILGFGWYAAAKLFLFIIDLLKLQNAENRVKTQKIGFAFYLAGGIAIVLSYLSFLNAFWFAFRFTLFHY